MPLDPSSAMALAGGGASLGGSLITSALNMYQANKQMDFQERMSSTAHQREVQDLKRAGLNPILSAKLGGSSTPPGAQAQIPDLGNSARSAIDAMSATADVGLKAAQMRDINAAAALKEAEGRVYTRTELERIDTVRETLRKLQLDSDISWEMRDKIQKEIRNIDQTLKLLKLDEAHSAMDLSRARQESDFYSSFGGKIAPWLDHILGKLRVPNIRRR